MAVVIAYLSAVKLLQYSRIGGPDGLQLRDNDFHLARSGFQ